MPRRITSVADLLLIQPPAYDIYAPPLGLATLASVLRQNEVTVKCLDYNILFYHQIHDHAPGAWQFSTSLQIWTDPQIYRKLLQPAFKIFGQRLVRDVLESGAKTVGISILQTGILPAIDLIETLREFCGDIQIILGGPSMNKQEARRFLDDYRVLTVIEGEAERALPEVMRRLKAPFPLSLSGIPGAIYKSEGQILSQAKDLITDINPLPFPDFSDFNLDQYAWRERLLPIATSRGCIARCRFCGETQAMGKFRELKPSRVVDELAHQATKHSVTAFRMNDSLINGNLEHLEAWLDGVIDRKLDIIFGGAQARINNRMSDELLWKLKECGCQLIMYGVESGSDSLLKIMRKGITSQDALEVIGRTSLAGIAMQVNIIVGHFEESLVDFLKSVLFVIRIRKQIQYLHVNCYDFADQSEDYRLATNIVNRKSPRWRTRSGLNNYYTRQARRGILLVLMKLFGIRES